MVVFGLPEDHLSSYPKAIEAVTVDEANAIGKQYFHPDKAAVIVVGDVSKIEDQVRELNLGPVYFLDADGHPIEKGTPTSPEE
jgi:zinc protease